MNPSSFCGSCGAVVKPGALYCGSCGSPAAAPAAAAHPAAPPAMIGTIGGGSTQPPAPQAGAWPPPAPQDQTWPSAGPVGAAGPAGFVGYATFGRRAAAYVIDAIPYLIIAAIGYVWAVAAISAAWRGYTTGLSLSYLLLLFGPLIYVVVLWVMAAKGNSPGNAILGIRVVREANGAFPGAGLGLGRLLLKGLLIGITFYIGGFSPLWDKTGRRKGWWDSACNTVVLDKDAVPVYRAAAGAAGVHPPAGAYPPADAYSPAEAYPAPGGYPAAGRPPTESDQQWVSDQHFGYPPAGAAGSTSLAGEGVPAAGGMPGTADDRPAWDIAPVQASDPVGLRPATSAPVATWGDRPADAVTTVAAFAAPPPPPPPPAPAARHAAPPTADPGPPADLPWAAVAEPSVISSVPGFRTPASSPADESPEHTRLRVAPQPTGGSGWLAELDDGRRLAVDGGLILGRDPSATPGDGAAVTVAVTDEPRSVSKTHLLVEVGPAGVQVTDRHSTNGVVVVTAGVELTCIPGVPTPVPDGSTVRFGDRSLQVRRG